MSNTINWIPFNDCLTVNEGEIIYKKEQSESKGFFENKSTGLTTIKSDRQFNEGEVSFDVELSDLSVGVDLVLYWGSPLYISFNGTTSAFGMRTLNQNSNLNLNANNSVAEIADKSSLQVGRKYSIKVTVKASLARLFIDGVEILSLVHGSYKAPISFNFSGSGSATVSNIQVVDYKPKVFVVMQFTDQFNDLYNTVIKPVCEEAGLEALRADDFYSNGLIINDIVNSIYESSVIIADITPNNPNVYYEVGFAHASNKNVILLCDREREKLPFDLSGFRTIFYSDSILGKDEVELNLRKHIHNIFP
ncbi:hypothetical protein OPW36_06315 [Vibrio europaeus]|uniref:hypothetical protein n=1 Tax=Vibrio europaeus TaxID=300876 RepID=UPI00233EDB6D|nr:hypothetical protein [Vibrio europaeus]MDC5808117.1 hypothetical protein [Vibrio europaeus]MDC5824335.1 hypothetical protein [Vibrio europaeus]MDC5832797.1 hypothetical protein [Vibrio europaeus]MDC5837675.1 hypothetical protein [Vibrio europaeus]